MALVQMVPVKVHHVRFLLRHVFTLIVWLSPQSPNPGTQRLPELPLLSFLLQLLLPEFWGSYPYSCIQALLVAGPRP